MKPLHVVMLLVVLAAGAAVAWSLGRGDDAPPPGSGDGGRSAPRREEPAGPAERHVAPAPAPAPTPASPPAPAPAPDTPAGPGTPARESTIVLLVRDAGSQAPIAAFQWRVRCGDGGVRRGEGHDGRAELSLPPGARGELLVEAPAHAPFTEAELAAPGAGEAPRELPVFLAAAANATGVSLTLRDTARQPIANVRVDAFALRPEDRELAWHLGTALWSRRAADAEGHYTLPELAPGTYGIRIVATDAQGELLPLLPFARDYALTGSNGFVEDVVLEPGCLPVLELVDAQGRALDPASGAVTLGLRLPGGPAVPRHWLQVRDGKAVRALDALPGPGPAWPAEALAGGVWQLDVLVDGQPALQRQITLRPGERQAERIVVP